MSSDTWHDHVDATWHPKGVRHGMRHVVYLCEWLTWSQVLIREKRRKEKSRKIRKIVKMTSG